MDDDGEASDLPDHWVPWLRSIRDHVHEHINPPCALGSGHRSLADKASAEVYKWALQEPFCKSLGVHAASYLSHTSDMGVEVGLPDFSIAGDVETLLPSWFHREELAPDVPMEVLGNGVGVCCGANNCQEFLPPPPIT
jgi:hypothetical protein